MMTTFSSWWSSYLANGRAVSCSKVTDLVSTTRGACRGVPAGRSSPAYGAGKPRSTRAIARRHDEVVTGLLEAARRLAAGRPDDGDLATVREAVAYFDRAVSRHFLDEEGSLFPRLSTRRPELAADLATLSAEHPPLIRLQNFVADAARDLQEGEVRPSAGMALLDAATKLAEAHRGHVVREDELFKLAQDALTAEDDTEIVAGMETRRDRDSGGGGGRGMRGGGRGRGGGGGGAAVVAVAAVADGAAARRPSRPSRCGRSRDALRRHRPRSRPRRRPASARRRRPP